MSSAYGVYAGGAVNFAARPLVSSQSGPGHKALELPANSLLDLALFKVEAKGDHASASIAGLRIPHPGAKTPGDLVAVSALSARCDNGVGTAELADVEVAGHRVPIGGPPNTNLLAPTAGVGLRVTPNKQAHNPDGTLTVVALELNLSLGDSLETIDHASATCGRADGRPAPTPTVPGARSRTAADSRAAARPQADTPLQETPRPTPIPTDLPVTG